MKPETKDGEPKISLIKKIWRYRKYFIVEPFVLCWILPSCFLVIGIQNLGLEKACRFTLGYDKFTCENVLDKSINGIDCEGIELDESNMNSTNTNTTISLESLMFGSYDFNYTVCKAELETQKKVTYINGIRGPMAAIFPVIVILFAGGWSDRKGLRKPCMLFPMIGETLSCTALLISAYFMETIPMEYGNILEKVLPAMLGGQTLMVMGIYSYLTATTPEEDRTFRFGIFGIFVNIVPIIGLPLAGTFYTQLGYVNLFILGDVFFILGIIYLVYFMKEVKPTSEQEMAKKDDDYSGQDNPGFDMSSVDNSANIHSTKIGSQSTNDIEIVSKKNCLVEFFDPTLAYDCIKVLLRKRERNSRMYLIILLCAYALFLGPTLGEIDYLYQFALIGLKWDGEKYSLYNTYSTAIVTVGTFLMTGVFTKIFKMSDSMMGLLSSICTVISRPMFAFSKGSILFYAAGTVDMFVSAKTIAIKTIISTMVTTEEIGRLYSVLGITDAFGGFIFPPIYSYIYSSTLDSFPGAFYLFGEIFFIPNTILFGLTYFLLRGQKRHDEDQQQADKIESIKQLEVSHI